MSTAPIVSNSDSKHPVPSLPINTKKASKMTGFSIMDLNLDMGSASPTLSPPSSLPSSSSGTSSETSSETSTPNADGHHSPASITPSPIDESSEITDEKSKHKRPSLSYNALIALAIQSSPDKRLPLQEIYNYIATEFPYYGEKSKNNDPQWKNSIRHNLSLHKEFYMIPRGDGGKGNFWAMNTKLGGDVFIEDGGKLRRRATKKGKRKAGEAVAAPDAPQFVAPPLPMFPQMPLPHMPIPLIFPGFPLTPEMLPFFMQNMQHFANLANLQNAPGPDAQ